MKRIHEDAVARAMVASILSGATRRGNTTVDMTPAQWKRGNPYLYGRLYGVACVFAPWANRVSVERMTVRRVAHALHAAYTVYCVCQDGLTRQQCRSWEADPPDQRAAYLDAARRILATLRRQAKAQEEGGVPA